MIKLTRLIIQNIGKIADADIAIDKPLMIFYGEIKQGKSTLLNAIRWAFGGTYPSDIIQHGEKEAFIELQFDGGSIRREWYIARDESTKARDIVFVRNGKKVPQPVGEIKRLLNPFILDQDHFRNMGELDRKRFLTELFAVDTTDLDTKLFEKGRKATELRAAISAFGDIDATEIAKPDLAALEQDREQIVNQHRMKLATIRSERDRILADHENAVAKTNEQRAQASKRGLERNNVTLRRAQIAKELDELKNRISLLKDEDIAHAEWLEQNPEIESSNLPERPDTSALDQQLQQEPQTFEIDAKIRDAGAQQVRYEQSLANKKRLDEKRAKVKELEAIEAEQRQLRTEKLGRLKDINEKSGIKDLVFDENGNFTYEGTHAGMLSTSQIMKLSSQLSALYPEGFGIDLIDRGESLGRSIFEYVERAKSKNTTILATVVGERPAEAPPEVGVFVVKDGVVIPNEQK